LIGNRLFPVVQVVQYPDGLEHVAQIDYKQQEFPFGVYDGRQSIQSVPLFMQDEHPCYIQHLPFLRLVEFRHLVQPVSESLLHEAQ